MRPIAHSSYSRATRGNNVVAVILMICGTKSTTMELLLISAFPTPVNLVRHLIAIRSAPLGLFHNPPSPLAF